MLRNVTIVLLIFVIINNLTFNTTYATYVDDTSVLCVSRDVNDSTLQSSGN